MTISKGIFFIIITFSLLLSTQSQTQFARFGLRGGVLDTDWIDEKAFDDKITYNGKVGAFIGFYSLIDLTSNWGLEYGLLNIVKNEDYFGLKSAQNSVFKIQIGLDL